MLKYFFLLCALTPLILSCQNYNVKDNKKIEIPSNVSIDIDDNGSIDFEVQYEILKTTDVPGTTSMLSGILQPKNGNSVLFHVSKGGLFLGKNAVININADKNTSWSNYSVSLLKKRKLESKWEKYWIVESDNKEDFYVALKILNDRLYMLAWLQLEFNTNTGEITIKDKKITTGHLLKIG